MKQILLVFSCLFVLISCDSKTFKSSGSKENNIEITDSQYDVKKRNEAQNLGHSKEVFLGFVLGSNKETTQNHIQNLLNLKKINLIPSHIEDYEYLNKKYTRMVDAKYEYNFFLEDRDYKSYISFNFDSEDKLLKQVCLKIFDPHNKFSSVELQKVEKLVDLFKIKYSDPIREQYSNTWFSSFDWLRNGYEIRLFVTEEKVRKEEKIMLIDNYFVYNIEFNDLMLEYIDADKSSKKEIKEKLKGNERTKSDL